MSGPLARLRALSFAQWLLLAEAVVALAAAAAAIAVLPFRHIVGWVRRRAAEPAAAPAARAAGIQQVRWAVMAAARRLPWRTKCFEQGLAAQWMLRRRGVATELHYGIARRADAELQAHVWVTAGDVPVVGVEIAGDFLEIEGLAAPR